MFDIACLIFIALFSAAAMTLIGCGNRAGLVGAVTVGVIGGLILSLTIPRDSQYALSLIAAVMTISAVAGAFLGTYIPESHRLKKFMRNQRTLRMVFGKYFRLGSGD